jgi:hypothetical protein
VLFCSLCGAAAPSADPLTTPLDWLVETDPRRPELGQRQYCPACARKHLRSIEAKLDAEYW